MKLTICVLNQRICLTLHYTQNNEKFGIPEEDTISITKENISEYKKSLENEGYTNLIDLLPFDLQMPDYLLL